MFPHATETMAERAWRYGLETQPGQTYCQGWLFRASVFLDKDEVARLRQATTPEEVKAVLAGVRE